MFITKENKRIFDEQNAVDLNYNMKSLWYFQC